MEAVIVPAKTLVHIGGIPVYLATATIVETSDGNMSLLTGDHYAHIPWPPAAAPPSSEAVSVEDCAIDPVGETGTEGNTRVKALSSSTSTPPAPTEDQA